MSSKPTYLYGEMNTPQELCDIYHKYDTSKNRERVDELNKLEDKLLNAPELYAMRGISNFELRLFNDSFADFEKAISLNPLNATYYHIRGIRFFYLGRFQDAIDDFDQILDTNSLMNHDYFATDTKQARVLSLCCLGEWKLARNEIVHIPDDYVFYIEPVVGRIDKPRLVRAIESNNKNWMVGL